MNGRIMWAGIKEKVNDVQKTDCLLLQQCQKYASLCGVFLGIFVMVSSLVEHRWDGSIDALKKK